MTSMNKLFQIPRSQAIKNKVETKSQKGSVNTCRCKKSYTKKLEGDGDIGRMEEQFDL